MFWRNVHPIPDGKARTIVDLDGVKKQSLLCDGMGSHGRLVFCCCPSDVGTDVLERVGRSRHRRCDPGRAHRLLHPRL